MSSMLPVQLVERKLGTSPAIHGQRYWMDGHPLKTHVMNALSAVFPIGERFFIDSVRAYEDKIQDPLLRQEVKTFIAQEAHHTKEHMILNKALVDQGYDLERLISHMRFKIDLVKRWRNPRSQLGFTVSVEHLTALLAHGLLGDPDFLAGVDEENKLIWRWHFSEEIEHKGVAYDVYMQNGGTYLHRCFVMLETSIFFMADIFITVLKLLKQDGQLWNWRMWKTGTQFFWGKQGVIRRLIPHFLAFFKRDFHPWNHDNRYLIDKYGQRFTLYRMPTSSDMPIASAGSV